MKTSLYFLVLFFLGFASCQSKNEEVSPFFYRISEADSASCMNEILEGILLEGKENQKRLDYIYNSRIPYCGIVDVYRIVVNSSGQVMLSMQLDSVDNVSAGLYNYCMFNRNVKETSDVYYNLEYEGFKFAYYNTTDMYEIESRLDELNNRNSSDPTEIQEIAERIETWEQRRRALELTCDNDLVHLPAAHVRFSHQGESDLTKRIRKEIAFAFYQMRNYECLRYFHESYLSLQERANRKKRKLDIEKLQVLRVIHPAIIFERDWSKLRPDRDAPEPHTELK